MPIQLWEAPQREEWLVLDRGLKVIDRGERLAELRVRHGDRSRTFLLVRQEG